MVMNDNKLIAIVRPGDKSGTGFHGGGESELRVMKRSLWWLYFVMKKCNVVL